MAWESPIMNGTANGCSQDGNQKGSLLAANGHKFTPVTKPIAIIGLSCRFPGDATSPEKLWELVSQGRSAWSEVPEDRFNNASFYHPQASNLGTTSVRGAHFLKEDVSLFDASFFNFSAEVAASMDPQTRLQLESVFEAIESAGITLPQLAGSNTSVFAATFSRDYHDALMRDPESLPRYFLTGNGAAMASNRLSHFFDLKATSVTVDTGCSAALTALHLACQSIRSGEAVMSVVGGVNLMLNPDMFMTMSSLGLLGPDGRSYSFDHRAQGYGRGEGVATLLLKPLENALRDGDPIRAVIRETALSQDGKTPTITSPSWEAQAELIRTCYRNAGLDPLDTSYVETHGTGTIAGDPIETGALGEVLGKGRSIDKPLWIGSVKSNIGHLEAASGLAAVIKVALAFEKRCIPGNFNFEVGNPEIPFEELRLRVPVKPEEWPEDLPRRASISNFGYGGANAHVIMEDAAYYLPPTTKRFDGCLHSEPSPRKKLRRYIFPISARGEVAAKEMVRNLQTYIESKGPAIDMECLAYTLGQRRTRFPWAMAPQASTVGQLLDSLETDTLKPNFAGDVPRLGFVFNGQGAQWFAMGRELMGVYPVFRQCFEEAEVHLRSFGAEWSLIEELTRDEKSTRVNETCLAMPLSVSIQIALVRLLESWNIKPTAVTSHSSGEISAAFAIGALDLRGALAAAYFRGLIADKYLAKDKSTSGSMLAVGLGHEDVEPYLKHAKNGKVVIACVNSPLSVTLSGDTLAIDEVEAQLKRDNIFARKLVVPVAYHSHHMTRLADKYQAALEANLHVNPNPSGILFSSPVTGGWITNVEDLSPAHWVKNMVCPVLFAQSLHNMCVGAHATTSKISSQHIDIIVEIGPHGALAGPIRQSMSARDDLKEKCIGYSSCLSRGVDAIQTMQALSASLLVKGYPVDIGSVNFPCGVEGLSVIQLPSYPWNHSVKFWMEPRMNKDFRNRKHAPHDLLGNLMPASNTLSPTWRKFIRLAEVPWVRDHVVDNAIVYPAAGQIAMVIEGLRQLYVAENRPIVGYCLRDVEFVEALIIPDTVQGAEVHLLLGASDDKALGKNWHEFHIYTILEDGKWIVSSKGRISASTITSNGLLSDRGRVSTEIKNGNFHLDSDTYSRRIEVKEFFDGLHAVGLDYGEVFQNLDEIRCGNGQSATTFHVIDSVALMPSGVQSPHVIHPITLDSLFQAAPSVLAPQVHAAMGTTMPRSIKSMFVSNDISSTPGHKFQTFNRLHRLNPRDFDISMAITSENGMSARPLVEITQMNYQSLGNGGKTADLGPDHDNLCLKCDWVYDMSVVKKAAYKQSIQGIMGAQEITLVEDLKRAVTYFILTVLKELTEEDISQLEWHHKILLEWFQYQHERAATDEIAPRSSTWTRAGEGIKHRLWDEVAAASVNGEMTVRIGKNLLGILRKEITPLELMMEGKLLEKYYENFLRIDRSFNQVAKLANTFSRIHPRAQILEIGGGTGSATGPVLRAMSDNGEASPRFSRYDFTDISPGFFEATREKFASWGHLMTFKKLDVETDPESQGFELESYDLIVACQVLHATRDMCNTLTNVYKLLKPGGKLIMVETTQDAMDVQLVFGVLPGWWLSTEPERKFSPNLPVSMWEDILHRSGFSGVDIAIQDCEDSRNYAMSVIMSTALPTTTADYPDDVVLTYYGSPPPREWLTSVQDLIHERTGAIPTIESLDKLNPVGKVAIFVSEVGSPVLDGIDIVGFQSIKALLNGSKGVLWISRGAAVDCVHPELALHLGLLRTRRLEDSFKRYIALDLDPQEQAWSNSTISHIVDTFATAFNYATEKTTLEFELAVRNGDLLIPRISGDLAENMDVTDSEGDVSPSPQPFFQSDRQLRMIVRTPGLLDSLVFIDDPDASQAIESDFVEIEVKAFGLNFRDIMVAMGQLKETIMGFECSGHITHIGPEATHNFSVGDRVCAFTGSRGHWAHKVRIHYTSVGKIPDEMSFETAASIPMVFVTAYYSLFEKARLEKSETILIHAAAGGVGQAAIILAQWVGAEIFVTVGSQKKREFLKEVYGIADDHILSSRDVSFATGIMAATKGRGVDVLLNSLAGELFQESWGIMATLGRFVEIGKRDIQLNKRLEMEVFDRATSFIAVDLIQVSSFQGKVLQRILKQCLNLLLEKQIRPIQPLTVYPISNIQRALQTMQAGNHLGKLIIKPGQGDVVNVLPLKKQVKLRPDASYLLVGGLGGIGRSLAQWFVARGAKNLILISRSAASQKTAQTLVKELENTGCRVVLKSCDITKLDDLDHAIRECYTQWSLPLVKGVIQAAMVLNDSIFEHMEYKQWIDTIRPKVMGTRNLHAQFENTLDFFIMLSSLAGVLGNASQANYAAGGTFQDAFACWRTSQGLPAVSIDLGSVKSVGYVAETKGVAERMAKLGFIPLEEDDMLRHVEAAIRTPFRPLQRQRHSQVITRLAQFDNVDHIIWRHDLRFTSLRRIQKSTTKNVGGGKKGEDDSLGDLLSKSTSLGEAVNYIADAIIHKLAGMFMLSVTEIDKGQSLGKYGVDSLVAVELRTWLVTKTQAQVSIFDILQSVSLVAVAEMTATKSKFVVCNNLIAMS